jgi:hypothetical protein
LPLVFVYGVGKTFMATALGHAAVRRRYGVAFFRTDVLLKKLRASRLDNSHDAGIRKLLRVDLLVLDDFALQPYDALDTADVYELIVERPSGRSRLLWACRRAPSTSGQRGVAPGSPGRSASTTETSASAETGIRLAGPARSGGLKPAALPRGRPREAGRELLDTFVLPAGGDALVDVQEDGQSLMSRPPLTHDGVDAFA